MNPVLTFKLTPAGAQLVLHALNQLPRGQVDALWQEIAKQYGEQVAALEQEAAIAAAKQQAVTSAE